MKWQKFLAYSGSIKRFFPDTHRETTKLIIKEMAPQWFLG